MNLNRSTVKVEQACQSTNQEKTGRLHCSKLARSARHDFVTFTVFLEPV